MIYLKLYLLDGYPYLKRGAGFPVVVELCSDQMVELAHKINVRELTISRLDSLSEDDFIGVLRMPGLGVPNAVFELDAHHGKFFIYDVLEESGDQVGALQSNEYRLRVVLDVFVKSQGEFFMHNVSAEKVVVVEG